MSKFWVSNGLRIGALLVACAALGVAPALARPRPGGAQRALNLFSGILGRQNANQFDCGLDAFGNVCRDPKGSTTVGGGFWPKGTPDQYVFNSGLQVAGIIDRSAGFTWAGDTTGTMFFNASVAGNGDKLSLVWSSLDPADVGAGTCQKRGDPGCNWPRDAYVPNDPSLYNPVLWDRVHASQQDTWLQYWDGNPANNSQRKHPLGILVTQRGMAWNFPTGNESVIYFIYQFTNVTAKDPAVYAATDPTHADTLASIGGRFQALNEAAYGINIPDGGYTIDSMYAAFAMDADVTDQATDNYSSVFFPSQMGFAYKGSFFEPLSSGYIFNPPTFSPPFAPTVGFVGVKYLRSPLKVPGDTTSGQVGLTLFSNFVNPNNGSFTDPANMTQLWRYLSANLNSAAGDPGCSAANPQTTHFCFISQTAVDIRFFESSGPMTLAPGETQTIVVAYITAPPVATDTLQARGPGFNLQPGLPATAAALAVGGGATDSLRPIDKVIGAVSVQDKNADGVIDQNEVVTVPRSLLSRGLVAQAVFDNKFLLPFPPDQPEFFLVPGDNQVTVVWRPSPTETGGDPYFQIASDPTQKLYDPNYRFNDVEGYRIYRGRTNGDLQLVAQFDYAGTEMRDYTGAFSYGNCAPELGVTADCPAAITNNYDETVGVDTLKRPVNPANYVSQPLAGNIIQIPPGGRVELANGNVLIVQTDTAVTSGGGSLCAQAHTCPVLSDNGVPFAFVDKGVRNSFRYFYAVTAFDVNSVASVGVGSTSLESTPVTKTVTPRTDSHQETGGTTTISLLSGSGATLNPNAPMPALDATTGEFAGPIPPADGLAAGFAVDVTHMITQASTAFKIDSVQPGNGDPDALGTGAPATYFVTVQRSSGTPYQVKIPVAVDCCDITNSAEGFAPLVAPVTQGKVTRFGGDSTFTLSVGITVTEPPPWRTTGPGRGDINDDPPNSSFNGPRWWAGSANENTANPNGANCHPAAGACSLGSLAGKVTAGSLPGVTALWQIQAYSTTRSFPMRDLEAVTSTVYRAADMSVYWGAGGLIDSVHDDTHGVTVPFNSGISTSWGILNDSSFVGVTGNQTPDTNNALLTWTDIFCVAPSPDLTQNCVDTVTAGTAQLMDHARLTPVAAQASSFGGAQAATATGNGFIFYLNGKFFLMQMAALPSSGTVWHARFYTGNILGTPGSFTYAAAARPPAVPGLRGTATFTGTTYSGTTVADSDLAHVHTVPDPYYVTNALEQSTNSKVLRFVNLPSQCIVRIYSLSGVLVNVLSLNDPTGGGEVTWNLRNRNNQFVASGVYFYHVETPDGKQKIGRFTVVNFAQ